MENEKLILAQIIAGSLLSLIPAVIALIIGYKNQKRQDKLENEKIGLAKDKNPSDIDSVKGDAVSKFATGYEKLCQDLQDQIDTLTKRQDRSDLKIIEQDRRISYLESGVRKLVKQVKDLGGDPVFDINGEEK